MIGGKGPSEYLVQLEGHKSVQLDADGMDKLLKTHSLDPRFLRDDDFEGFIESRRQILLDQISQVMEKPPMSTNEAVPEDDEGDEDE
jgi:hypothetical protein